MNGKLLFEQWDKLHIQIHDFYTTHSQNIWMFQNKLLKIFNKKVMKEWRFICWDMIYRPVTEEYLSSLTILWKLHKGFESYEMVPGWTFYPWKQERREVEICITKNLTTITSDVVTVSTNTCLEKLVLFL